MRQPTTTAEEVQRMAAYMESQGVVIDRTDHAQTLAEYLRGDPIPQLIEQASAKGLKQFPEDRIVLCCDGAAWHKSASLIIPENIRLVFIPPYTPEMNPIEQIWKELRATPHRK